MIKFRFFNINVVLRATVVVLGALLITLLGGLVLGSLLDTAYRHVGVSFFSDLYFLLSNYRYTILVLVAGVAFIVFSGWILQPIFSNIIDIMTSSLRIGEDDRAMPVFPRSLRAVEEGLTAINQKIRLWQYALRESEQRKDDLVVYLAHDIRTPLTSVLGYLELLSENPELPAAQREKYTEVALRKAQRMQSLVEELFEVTRFNIGNIELMRGPADAEILFKQLAEEMMPLLKQKNISFRVENQGLHEIYIDADKMARALDNVLHNAAYYTPPEGSIEVVLRQTEEQRACFSIANSGADIAPEKLQRFFEKFYRGDEARQSGAGGSGLGLAIAKNIIEAHGGQISARNEDHITTFEIVL